MSAHRSHRLVILFTLVLAAMPLITGCSQFEHFFGDLFGGDTSDIEPPPQQLAIEGMEHLKAHRYKMAIDKFQKIKDLHPYSKYAILADLKIADAHYLNKDYEKAMVAYQEFEQLHPNNDAVPYVIHQQGMCYLAQVKGFDREQVQTVRAIQTFSRLMQTYPDSRYSAMALARLTEAQTSLAHHEFYVGMFYYKGGHYKAALGRFVSLIKNYPDTGFHAQALEYIRLCRQHLADMAPDTPAPAASEEEFKELPEGPSEPAPTPPTDEPQDISNTQE